jgi:hypothetical protein
MTCKEFENVLPDMIDGQAEGKHASHLDTCGSCSDLVMDLKAIASGAKLLCAADEPSPRVWANIQRTLEQEGIIKLPTQLAVVVPARRRLSLWAWATPLAAIVVLAVGVLLYNGHPSQPATVPEDQVITPTASLQRSTSQTADDDEVLAGVAPSARTMYADNLQAVNLSIQDAQQELATDPANDEARHLLMDAYQQKEMLYQLAMDRSAE